MTIRLASLQRMTVAFIGAVACTVVLVVASAPVIPVV